MPSPAPEPLAPRPLSVWLVNPFDDIPGEGLPPLRYWTLARILAGRGHDVTWWSSTWSHRRKAQRTPPRDIQEDEGFRVRLVASRPYTNNVSLARLRSHQDFARTFERVATEAIAARQLERPDVLVASLPPLESPEAAARFARRVDATFILDVQDLWPETFERLLPGPAFVRRILAPLFLGRMHRRRLQLVSAADAVSATTRTFLEAVLRDIPSPPRRHVCQVGAYLQEFACQTPAVNQVPLAGEPDTSVEPPPLQCVYAGSLEAGQDLDALLAAVRLLASQGTKADIHVAGTGRFEPVLRAAATAGGDSCRLHVHGLLPRHDYARLLGSCDVGLVLVKPESKVVVPNKACDYAAAGLALVNSLGGELATLLEEHGAGIAYTPGDGGSLARAITTLANDRRHLLACRQAARRLAAAEFDREKLYGRFADWLETISD